MSYPVITNWVKFKRIDNKTYLVKNLLDDSECEMDCYYIWFAHQLDGKTDPYIIDKELTKEEVCDVLEELEYYDIIRCKRFLSKNIFNLLVTLWKPKSTKTLRLIAFLINFVFLISFIPLIVIAIWRFLNSPFDISMDYYFSGLLFGVVSGMVLHETAHFVACLGYGGSVFEIGVMLRYFIPGAYVLMDVKNIKNKMHRIQVFAAGVEMNLILSSIFLILALEINSISGFFYGASICNVMFAFINLTFAEGLDGMTIIGELLGVDDLPGKAKGIVKNKRLRIALMSKGVTGKCIVALCYIIKALQISMPILIAVNIMEVFLWIL